MSAEIQESSTYLLLTWLESQNIKTMAQAAAALEGPSILHELRDIAEQSSEFVETPPIGLNLVAGTGLRLDDDLTCPSPGCRRQQVDILFRHAWHYFDRILLPDGVGYLLRYPPEGWSAEYLRQVLAGMIDVALHIQQIGADSLVHYYPRKPLSVQDFDEAFRNVGDEHWAEAWRSVEATLIAEGHYEFERVAPGRFIVHCSDPFLEVGHQITLEFDEGETQSEDILSAEAAHMVMHDHIAHLEQDLSARHVFRGPLGSAVWSHEHVLSHLRKVPEIADVLIRITLPSLSHVPIKDLISLRVAEGDAFLACRSALTKAAREIVANNRASSPGAAAAEIAQDIIEPELAKLRQRLLSATRTLKRKTAVSIALAGISTLFGLLLGASPITAACAGGAGFLLSGAGSAASKYLDEKQAVEISDMFFLWKALHHAE